MFFAWSEFCSGSSRSDFSCIRHWKVFSLTYEASGMIFGRHARVFLTASYTHTVRLDPRLHSDCARPSSYQFVKIVSVGSGRISRGPAGFSATTTNRIMKVTVILWSFTNASRGEETWKSFMEYVAQENNQSWLVLSASWETEKNPNLISLIMLYAVSCHQYVTYVPWEAKELWRNREQITILSSSKHSYTLIRGRKKLHS